MLFLHLNFDGIKTVVGDFSITGTHTLCIVMYLSKRGKQKERNSHNFIALFYPKIVLKEHHHISARNTVNWFPSEGLKNQENAKASECISEGLLLLIMDQTLTQGHLTTVTPTTQWTFS